MQCAETVVHLIFTPCIGEYRTAQAYTDRPYAPIRGVKIRWVVTK